MRPVSTRCESLRVSPPGYTGASDSERLGHINPAFTMSVNQHVRPGTRAADAARAFRNAVFGRGT